MFVLNLFRSVIFLLAIFLATDVACQKNQDLKGFSIYKEYDKSFITPELRGKHTVLIGGAASSYTPELVDIIISPGFQIGYNYLVLERRQLKSSRKGKYRDEPRLSVGVNFAYYFQDQFALSATFYRPWAATNGRLFSWIFFSEYGLGALKGPKPVYEVNKVRLNLNLEIFRLRIGKLPMYIHSNFNYDLRNDFLAKERINLGFSGGIRYYIYKTKV